MCLDRLRYTKAVVWGVEIRRRLTLENHHQNADPSPVNKLPIKQSRPRLELGPNLRRRWFQISAWINVNATTGRGQRRWVRLPNELSLHPHLEHLDLNMIKIDKESIEPRSEKHVWIHSNWRGEGQKKDKKSVSWKH